MALYLSESDVSKLLTVSDAIHVVEDVFRAMDDGTAVTRPRERVRMKKGVLHVMPAAWEARGYFGFKAYASFATTRFWFWLFDASSGELLAILSADRLGQRRTGAASAVATKLLARPDARSLGIFGTGWQAQAQVESIAAVIDVHTIRCYSRDRERREAFAEKMSLQLDVPIEPVERPQDAARGCGIVVTATAARDPVLRGEWLEPGMHVNAIGANWAHRREIDEAVVQRSDLVVVDSLEQAKRESGDLIIPAELGLWKWDQALELSELVKGKTSGRTSSEEITLFKSNGIAAEDVAVAAHVYERARELQVKGEAGYRTIEM